MKVVLRWNRPETGESGAGGPTLLGLAGDGGDPPLLPGAVAVTQETAAHGAAPRGDAPHGEPCIIGKLMLEATGASDPGCVRSNNEDYFLVTPSIGLYLVADGMGGAQAGEHASKLAAETVWEIVYQNSGSVTAEMLVSAFEEANRRILEAAGANPEMEGMGTTLVAAVDTKDGLLIASVGDSRAYLYDNGVLQAITDDQTWVNEVGRRLGLSEDALKTHPMRHVLTMAVGVSQALRVNTYLLQPTPGMQVLLCSDGLHGVAPESALAETLASEATLEDKCKRLIDAARNNGGPDNVTAVLLRAA
jgi:serine/threonine protein phosphatase PrpC